MGFIFLVIFILLICLPDILRDRKAKEEAERSAIIEQRAAVENQRKYDIERAKITIPSGAATVTVITHHGGYLYDYRSHYIWVAENNLYLYPSSIYVDFSSAYSPRSSSSTFDLIKIPLNKIMFYRQTGDVFTTIEGSVTTSVVTGIEGNITQTRHDNRITQLVYEQSSSTKGLLFNFNDYYDLRRIIPTKDYAIVNNTLSKDIISP